MAGQRFCVELVVAGSLPLAFRARFFAGIMECRTGERYGRLGIEGQYDEDRDKENDTWPRNHV